MRRELSRVCFDLDEDATVTRIANTEVWMPVVRPRRERWLELDLVIEDSKTTAIWERAIAELKHLVEYQGAFRSVRLWRLRPKAEGSAEIALYPGWYEQDKMLDAGLPRSRSPKELVDVQGRRLVWVVSDCTSRLWRNPPLYNVLQEWTRTQPVAIMQMFPDHLWTRTALRNGHIVRLGGADIGGPSARLTAYGLPQRLRSLNDRGLVTVPLITLNPEILDSWCQMMVGRGGGRSPGRVFEVEFIQRKSSPSSRSRAPQTSAQQLTAQERVNIFRATASSNTVIQLANLMAAAPVSLPVIDLLCEAFRYKFRDKNVQQHHVAEVLLSSLLRRVDGDEDQLCQYEFWGDFSDNPQERVREILLGDASLRETVQVLDVLSQKIDLNLESPVKTFEALLGALEKDSGNVRAKALPFARVGLSVLRKMGGEQAKLANRYDPGKTGTITVSRRSPSEIQLETIEFEVAVFERGARPIQLEEFTFEPVETTSILTTFEFETATIAIEDVVVRAGVFGVGRKVKRRPVISRQRASNWGYTEELTGDVGLDMMLIPEGTFLMGAPEDELESLDRERPQYEVTVPSFYCGRYPVTQEQWRVVAGYSPIERELNPNPSKFKGSDLPVEQVSWEEAQEFCLRLSYQTGKTYRLPSEAEWEYTCRAGTTTPFYFGETLDSGIANYDAKSDGYQPTDGDGVTGEYRKKTTVPGLFPGNQWGLYDMHGNVWEWCEDDWHDSYEGASADGSPWIYNKSTSQNEAPNKLLRGGSWLGIPRNCRSAFRYSFPRVNRYHFVGFRVVCSPQG